MIARIVRVRAHAFALKKGIARMSGPEQKSASQGWLIVEDESLIAMLVQDAVEEMGLATMGPASRVAHALQLLNDGRPDGAILDVNLDGEKVYPVADELMARNIPFMFLTGYG